VSALATDREDFLEFVGRATSLRIQLLGLDEDLV
jgi:hypothetical protein